MSSSIQVKVPVLPESVRDATIATWHKKAGDQVKRDENLVDLETDKVVLEVPSPCDGILSEILKEQGSTVTAQEVLANITPGKSDAGKEEPKKEEPKKEEVKKEEPKKEEPKKEEAEGENTTSPNAVPTDATPINNMGPSARRKANESGLTTNTSTMSSSNSNTSQPAVNQSNQNNQTNNQTHSSNADGRSEKRVPMTRLRARIAQRLVESQQTAAILTTFNEINMKPVMDLRVKYKDDFEKAHKVRLGFMSFFVKACVEALKRFPAVNASIDGNDVIYHGYFDIGVAVSSDRGLVVPILRDVDRKSMADIESEIRNYGERAQKGQLSIEEMTGGTFTVSNGGVFGSLLSTPIINPPQSAILGMHKIEERPVVENGQIVIRPMMYVALSYDHRIIDGKESVSFLRTIKELLEDPSRIILDV